MKIVSDKEAILFPLRIISTGECVGEWERTNSNTRTESNEQPASQRKNEMGQTVGEEHTRELLNAEMGTAQPEDPENGTESNDIKV